MFVARETVNCPPRTGGPEREPAADA
jgi:hypothetical protein